MFLVNQRPLFCMYSPLPPLRGQPTVEYHPRWQPIQAFAIHVDWGDLDSNLGLQVDSLVSQPMSPHCSQSHHRSQYLGHMQIFFLVC
jgi:hypothetical protein